MDKRKKAGIKLILWGCKICNIIAKTATGIVNG